MKQLLFLLIIFPALVYAQDCTCTSAYNWVKKTFEENDSGYQYIIDTKGEKAYDAHNLAYADKIFVTEEKTACHEIINEWLQYFRKGHIGLELLAPSDNEAKKENNDSHEKWETFSTDLTKFKAYLGKKSINDFEGIWETGPYQIAIKKEGKLYIGFIVNSEETSWKKNQVKLKITDYNGAISSQYFMFNRTSVSSNEVALFGPNNLQIGSIYLTRIYPKIKDDSSYDLHFKALNSVLPFIEELDDNTLYFRIPSFLGTVEKTAIDSVISLNKEKILSTKNLIIDIRNGTGGSDDSYYEILPFLYTNPIRRFSMEFKSTELNNQRMLDISNNEGYLVDLFGMSFDEDERIDSKKKYDTLSQNLGAFVDLDTASVSITTFDTVYPYPQNVGIIHNKENGSTDEQFLLTAKQSRKVKLYGTPTMGALDFSNLNRVASPCGDFALWYTLSKSSRIPEMAIDGKGIQPDFYINKDVPEYDWINYVSKLLNE